MPIETDIKDILNEFDPIFTEEIKYQNLNLLTYMENTSYDYGYSLPAIHISKLQELLSKKEEEISKYEIIDLFLSIHGQTMDGFIDQTKLDYRKKKMEKIANNLNFKTHHFKDYDIIEFAKFIGDWLLVIFYDIQGTTSDKRPEILVVSLLSANTGQMGDIILSNEFNKLVQTMQNFQFRIEFLGREVTKNFNELKRKENVHQTIVEYFMEDPELKKLNPFEVIKDTDIRFTGDWIELNPDQYHKYRYFKYLLLIGSLIWNDMPASRLSTRNNILNEKKSGMYLEISLENVTFEKWKELKEKILYTLTIINR